MPRTVTGHERRNFRMRSHARVVVIGGGVVGVSTLYHLTKLGWTDVVLLERSERLSGSALHHDRLAGRTTIGASAHFHRRPPVRPPRTR